MNFIYIHTHDSGREMQPYGIAANNPGLMRLAGESIVFRQAHCVAPTCSPSRAALLTGMTAHQSGMLGLAHRGFALCDYDQHLARYLRRCGYYTALIGVQHEAIDPAMIGYDEWHTDHVVKKNPAHVSDERSTALVLDFLRAHKGEAQPFFLSFGLRSTHRDFLDTDHALDNTVRPPYPIVDTPETRHDYVNYLRCLEGADRCVSALLDGLRETGLDGNTVVLFTTDHGVAFPQMKGTLYDTGTGVALMLRCPGLAPACSDALVSHLDVFPTICDLLGLSKPAWLQGESLLPLWRGEAEEIHDCIFTETTYHATYEPARAVRTKTHKLIRFYEDDTAIRPANIDDSACKDAFLAAPAARLPRRRELLFDLAADPAERHNLIDEPAYAEVYARLSAALDAHMRDTDDPLCNGPVPLRDGWVMNPIDALSPSSPTYNNRGEPARAKKPKKGS